mgnify:CR=1 FL=1
MGVDSGVRDGGIVLPSRSSIKFAKAVLADAVRGFVAALSQSIASARIWHKEYLRALRSLTAVCASAPATAAGIAAEGLESARGLVRCLVDSVEAPLSAGLWRTGAESFETATVTGTADAVPELRITVDGVELAGPALKDKLVDWRRRGIVEPSFVTAIERVIDNPKWLTLPGYQVVICGAGNEIAPFEPLTRWGAEVLIIDKADPDLWQRLIDTAKAGAGSVTYPTGQQGPGADIAAQFPAVLDWILANTSKRRKLVFGSYSFGDAGARIETAIGADVLATELLDRRSNAGLAYVTTPTDCFAVKADVMAESRRRWADRGIKGPVENALRFASRSALFKPNYREEVVDANGIHWGIADALAAVPGPEYAFARRLQRWRGVLTREQGRPVSFNVAPATWTGTVRRNRMLTSTYIGAARMGVEVFEPETTRTLAAAKLVSDLFAPELVAAQANPEELFYDGAAHSGVWRQPFEPITAMYLAVATGYPLSLLRR